MRIGRRRFMKVAVGSALAAIAHGGTRKGMANPKQTPIDRHLAWVWRFDDDGDPAEIRDRLVQLRAGILLKTHDGSTYMGKWDTSWGGVTGPEKVRELADFFESAGVPFHAWSVTRGVDPVREAEVAAEVLANGARSMTFDLEPPEGKAYWQRGPAEALQIGYELRRRMPDAYLVVAPDPRPWQLEVVPIAEFASFCNEIAPQTYWDTFDSPANYRLFEMFGYPPGPDGITPEHVLTVTNHALAPHRRLIRPVGQATASHEEWARFLQTAEVLGMGEASFWRFRTAGDGVWQALSESAAKRQQQANQVALSAKPKDSPAQGEQARGQGEKVEPLRAKAESAQEARDDAAEAAANRPYRNLPRFRSQFRLDVAPGRGRILIAGGRE